jgi:hypothetical protein
VNIQVLIDSIVRQTTVLIAQLATSGGVRAPLAHIANRVFMDLTAELDRQGVSRKVGADMFGMALRAYQRKIQRIRESSTDQGQSLWSAVLQFLRDNGVLTRRAVFSRFAKDDPALVRSVLHDLTETGLAFHSGTGDASTYRALTEEELREVKGHSEEGMDELVWLVVYRDGPLTSSEVADRTKLSEADILSSLGRLEQAGRVTRSGDDTTPLFSSREFVVPLGQASGWEAAVLDHYQAVVRTLCRRLEVGAAPDHGPPVGGSTYTFDVWPGHPFEEDVYGTISEFRNRASALRKRVEAHNAEHGMPADYTEVIAYAGQSAFPRGELVDREEDDT